MVQTSNDRVKKMTTHGKSEKSSNNCDNYQCHHIVSIKFSCLSLCEWSTFNPSLLKITQRTLWNVSGCYQINKRQYDTTHTEENNTALYLFTNSLHPSFKWRKKGKRWCPTTPQMSLLLCLEWGYLHANSVSDRLPFSAFLESM